MSNANSNGSKGGKRGPKGAVATVVAAVASAIVKTLDGTEVSADKAVTLAREALVAYKRTAGDNSPIAQMLSGIIATYDTKGPDAFVFASAETPKAKGLVGALARVRVKGDIKLFVPLTEERAKRDAYLKSKGEKTEADKQAADRAVVEARAKVEAEAKRKADARAKRMVEEQTAADVLAGFVDQTVVDEKKQAQADREAAHATREARIKPFALGQAVVVLDQGRPTMLRATLEGGIVFEAPIVSFAGLQAYGDRTKAPTPADTHVTCTFCERDMKLGEMLPARQQGQQPMPAVQQVGFIARTPDGSRVWSYTRGPKDGKPRPQNVLTCKGCASIARGIGPKVMVVDNRAKQEEGKPPVMREVPEIRSYDLYRSYMEWVTNAPRHATGEFDGAGEPVMAPGEAAPLKVPAFSADDLKNVADAVGKGDSK